MTKLSPLKRLDVSTVWPNEAYDFTPWLAKNLDMLGEALGIEMELVRTEEGVGTFSLDLLGKDLGSGEAIVIENQYGFSDHDHLGKLITYASGVEAAVVVWISEHFREEHRQALDWLNQRTDLETKFFGVSVEVLQIDASNPAIKFRLLAFPNDWRKNQKAQSNRQLTPRQQLYLDFFQSLIDELREAYHFTSARVAFPQNWYLFGAGTSGVNYGAVFGQGNKVRTEIYLDAGEAEVNKAFFDELYKQRDLIESEFGDKLHWQRKDDAKASRIAYFRKGSIDANDEELQAIKSWMIEHLLLFKKIFGKRIEKLEK